LAKSLVDPAAIESPAWHEEELAERERKIESERQVHRVGKAKAEYSASYFVRIEIRTRCAARLQTFRNFPATADYEISIHRIPASFTMPPIVRRSPGCDAVW